MPGITRFGSRVPSALRAQGPAFRDRALPPRLRSRIARSQKLASCLRFVDRAFPRAEMRAGPRFRRMSAAKLAFRGLRSDMRAGSQRSALRAGAALSSRE